MEFKPAANSTFAALPAAGLRPESLPLRQAPAMPIAPGMASAPASPTGRGMPLPKLTRTAPPALNDGCARGGWFRRFRQKLLAFGNKASSDFWLSFFFYQAHHHPWFARGTKPFFLYFVWRFSEHLYGGTMANARRILGENSTVAQRQKLARQTIDSFYDFVLDVGHALGKTPQQLLDRIEHVEGAERYLAVRHSPPGAGKGAIVVTAHMGSFEVGAAALLKQERKMHVLFRRDALGLFEKIRSQLRHKLGVAEVPLDEGWTIWMRLRDALAQDEVVLIQGDRVMPGQKGQPVKFFEGHILLPTGPVRLALLSGAPIIPVFTVRTPTGGIRLFIDEPMFIGDAPGGISTDEGMNRIGAVLEKYVRRFPDQWLENRPAWIEDAGQPMLQPPGKRRVIEWKMRLRKLLRRK